MFKNNKSSLAGAVAPVLQHLLPALAARARGMRFLRVAAFRSLVPIAGPAGAHAYRYSQVIFFGHDLPMDYARRR
jgi:hypothetical protein